MATYRFVALISVLVFVVLVGDVEAAKKRRKHKGNVVTNKIDSLKCGVCFAVVDEILHELRQTENSTSTLDLRWGLTAEVTEGRAKRIGKVIPYKRSQLRAVEIMEKVCETMKDYGKFEGVKGEIQLKRTFKREGETGDVTEGNYESHQIKKDREEQKKFESICEDFVESNEQLIIETIREEMNEAVMEDVLCFGSAASPCGPSRSTCAPGSFGPRNGSVPCVLCMAGTFQSESGQTACVACGEHENTTGRGANASSGCVKECQPGWVSATGLEPGCHECGLGTYQGAWGRRSCEACPEGLGTRAVGSVFLSECVSVCGDARRAADEACDDGNTYPGDGCSPDCKVETGHVCSSPAAQRSSCSRVVCGDGRVEAPHEAAAEACDDGNTAGGDGCDAGCRVEAGWACSGAPSRCNRVVCGDGLRQDSGDGAATEECDDGNTDAGDGCGADCKVEAGGVCEGPRDGRQACRLGRCGDGSVDGAEECDDGNDSGGDGCAPDCRAEAGWACETGAVRWGTFGAGGSSVTTRAGGPCRRKEQCGDGERTGAEECDDGNTEGGDGCGPECKVEAGFECAAAAGGPDRCSRRSEL